MMKPFAFSFQLAVVVSTAIAFIVLEPPQSFASTGSEKNVMGSKSSPHASSHLLTQGVDRARQLTFAEGTDSHPDWSADGRFIVFDSKRDGQDENDIWLMETDGRLPGRNFIQITTNTAPSGRWGDWAPRWHKPGTDVIFFITDRDAVWKLCKVTSAGNELGFLPLWTVPGGEGATSPSFSPDGSKFVLTRAGSHLSYPREYSVWVFNHDASAPKKIYGFSVHSGPLGGNTAFWSPDGERIAFDIFNENNPSHSEIWTMDTTGANLFKVTSSDSAFDSYPRWSPNGKQLAFHSNRTGNWDIWIVNADGAGLRQVTKNPGDDLYPTWSPDGELLAFASNRGGDWNIWSIEAQSSAPEVLSVKDVPHDQGGSVTVIWQASPIDTTASYDSYSVWRALPAGLPSGNHGALSKSSGQKNGTEKYRLAMIGDTTYAWEFLTEIPAHSFLYYSYTAETLYDSTSTTEGQHYFMVSYHVEFNEFFFDSNVMAGYSVDNLPPQAPVNIQAKIAENGTSLHWTPSTEPDFWRYLVYKSATAQMNVDELEPFAATSDTIFSDSYPQPGEVVYYCIRAQDMHGNLSPKSEEVEVMMEPTDVQDGTPGQPNVFALYQNYPNPFNPGTTIKYTLPQPAIVSLRIFDLTGKVVDTLVDSEQHAGEYAIQWRPENVPSGVYIFKLRANDFSDSYKLILMK